jgi:hypothetical protein
MSQNTQSKEVNLTLPTLTLNTARFYPFAKKGGTKKGIIQNINLQYSLGNFVFDPGFCIIKHTFFK